MDLRRLGRLERSLRWGRLGAVRVAEPSAGYLPGVRLFPRRIAAGASGSRRPSSGRRPGLARGLRVHPDGHERFLGIIVAVVASHGAGCGRGMRGARAAVRGTRRGRDARYGRTVPRARCASRVARVGVGRGAQPKASEKTKRRAFHRKMRGCHTRRLRVCGVSVAVISRATFCTPGYSSPVHTTSKLSSRRRRITCHGPG